MKYEQLSGYEKFILLTEGVSAVSANVSSYNEFKLALEALTRCAKSDTKTMRWKGDIIIKPVGMYEAEKALRSIKANKWDHTVFLICNALKIPLHRRSS
jgi:hypothetical protein